MLGAASTIAFAVLGLPAGAWIDRVRRQPVLVASDLVRVVLWSALRGAREVSDLRDAAPTPVP